MTTVGERNKVMKLLDTKGYDPTYIEEPSPYTVEIARYQKYGELLKNSVESYPSPRLDSLLEHDSEYQTSLYALSWADEAMPVHLLECAGGHPQTPESAGAPYLFLSHPQDITKCVEGRIANQVNLQDISPCLLDRSWSVFRFPPQSFD